jgi:hypothetical protein
MKRIILLSVIVFTSCTTYTHTVDRNIAKQFENYKFAGTYTFDCTEIDKAKSAYEDVNGNISKENEKRMDSLFVMRTPTYFELQRNVKHKFGDLATFSNVVWDIKHTNILGLKSQHIRYVTFDLYLPK